MRRSVLFGVLVCFFVSGAAGLVYQVAWGKALGLIFGHTVYAIATVLAVFMGGLALGSAWLGRWSERHSQPLTLYGWIELGVAGAGAFSLAGLAGVRALYLAFYHAVAGSTAALLALRFIGAAIVLFVPTFLMGGTLPILVRGLTRSSSELGARISRLYWVNTAGAVAGTLAAGFLFLPALGLRLTVALAVALNVLAGATALWLSRSTSAPTSDAAPVQETTPALPPQRLLLLGFAIVGATAMAYEIAWTRLLATMLGSSTYAFTLMLATFLIGIVLGSLLFERWVARSKQVRLSTFALTQSLTAVAAAVFLISFQQLPRVVPPLLRATHETFAGLVLTQFLTSALAMLPAAIIFGFNFPAVAVLIAGRPGTSQGHAAAVGRAYAANTLGAILGATATGFWLVPRLGSFRAVALAAGVNLLLAAMLELCARPRRLVVAAADMALLAAIATVVWSGAFYNRTLATFGTVLYWNLHQDKLTPAESAATIDVPYAVDGLNASISVGRAEDYLGLRTNGKVDASNHDTATQLLLGHLGSIFHRAPRRVLIIGFGSGMTASAVARYPEVERIDCVEIEPAVIGAAPYLEQLNRGVLRDPRLHLVFDDARNFLLTARDQYDLIISEPSNPWIAGVASLFTEEYYRAARARLALGGAFVQWLQAYSLYPEDLRMVLGSFVPQFPHVTLWRGDKADMIILGRAEAMPLSLDRMQNLWSDSALRADYETLGLQRPYGLIAFHLLDDADLRRLIKGTSRNTDDHTRLEYRAPRALLDKQLAPTNHAMVLQYRTSLLPQDMQIKDRNAALLAAAETSLLIDQRAEAQRFLEPLLLNPPVLEVAILRGRLELAYELLDGAKSSFATALRLDPNSLDAAHGVAEVARLRGDHAGAQRILAQILARDPNYVPALDSMMLVQRNRENWKEAASWQARRLNIDPAPNSKEYCRLGELFLRLNDAPRAEHALLASLQHDPYSYAAHRNLGEFYHDHKLWALARQHLEFVVRFFPDSDAGTYSTLAQVYRATGDVDSAVAITRKGLRFFPTDQELLRLRPLD